MHPDALVTQFHRARLDLKVTAAPLINAGNAAIVQLDIARQPQQFLLWKGDRHNELIVQGTDKKLRQLVLFVREPRRAFEVRVRKEAVNGRKVLRKENSHFVWVEEFTVPGRRHLLCGMDEQHCFVAQLPYGVATVQEAHQALFNPAAGEAARAAGAKVLRQGEWFFVRAAAAELEALARHRPLVHRHVATTDGSWRRGRPHLADQLVRVTAAVPPVPAGAVYVRGSVRHPDHRALHLPEWHRVFGNNESSHQVGVQWAD